MNEKTKIRLLWAAVIVMGINGAAARYSEYLRHESDQATIIDLGAKLVANTGTADAEIGRKYENSLVLNDLLKSGLHTCMALENARQQGLPDPTPPNSLPTIDAPAAGGQD